jgi:VanZ family protein
MRTIIASPTTLPLAWILFFMLTHWPQEEMPQVPFIPHFDKVVHISLFAVLGFLLCHRVSRKRSYKKKLGIVLVVLAAYGAFDELTQPFVGRTAEILDWVADIIGAYIGFAIHQHWTKEKVQVTNLHS